MRSIPKEIRLALKRLEDSGNEAYVVGGAVRNMLLNEKVNDYDITTSASPNTIRLLFPEYNQYVAGKKYGTVVILIGKYKIDITTFRKDLDYLDHRHPKEVEFTTNLYEDLKRRDFTINALCLDLKSNLTDYFNGIDDLHNGIIRAIGNPKTRFNEDALRILRGIKFATRLNFRIEKSTEDAIFENARLLNSIANERKKDELLQILSYPNRQKYINRYLEVFKTFIPFKKTDKRIDNFLDSYFSLAYLLSKTSGYNLKDLKFSKNEINMLNELIKSTDCDIKNDYEFIMALSSVYEKEILAYLSQLHNLDLTERYKEIKPYIVDLNSLNITGQDLMALGFNGSKIKEIKNLCIGEIRHKRLKNNNRALRKFIKDAGI